MKAPSFATVLALVQCAAACTYFDTMSDADVQEARRSAVSSQSEFRRIASMVAESSIIDANGKTVRYRLDGDVYRTDPWETAQVSPVIRDELRDFIAAGRAKTVSVNRHRVNFVIRGVGLAVSGVTVGVIVAPAEEAHCSEIVTLVKLDRRGLQCERLDRSTYFYLWPD